MAATPLLLKLSEEQELKTSPKNTYEKKNLNHVALIAKALHMTAHSEVAMTPLPLKGSKDQELTTSPKNCYGKKDVGHEALIAAALDLAHIVVAAAMPLARGDQGRLKALFKMMSNNRIQNTLHFVVHIIMYLCAYSQYFQRVILITSHQD